MNSVETDKIVFLILIAGRAQTDALLSALSEAGARMIDTVYGRGTVEANYLQNLLGLVPEENKVVITSLLTCAKSNVILNMLVEKFHFNKPNTGVAFTIPVDRVSF